MSTLMSFVRQVAHVLARHVMEGISLRRALEVFPVLISASHNCAACAQAMLYGMRLNAPKWSP